MRKVILLLTSLAIQTTTISTVTACEMSTPPLTVDDLILIMNHLKEEAIHNQTADHKIYNVGTIDKFVMPNPGIDDLKNPTSKNASTNAKTALDKLTNLASNWLAQTVNNQKTIAGANDAFYQNQHLNYQSFKATSFTIYFANIYAAQFGNDGKPTSPSWLYTKSSDNTAMTDFSWKDKNNNEKTFVNNDQIDDGIIKQQGSNYSRLNFSKLWADKKLFTIDNNQVKRILSPYPMSNSYLYTIRALITFAPSAKFGTQPIIFYLEMNLDSE